MYATSSVLTFILFWIDKRAAQRATGSRGSQRVPEATLHILELLGGFPGALLGQRLLRHKSAKRRYRAVLGLIVVLHLIAWAVVLARLWR
jgi:uncharacterized membrane protein YsdA (DUF1294 family)